MGIKNAGLGVRCPVEHAEAAYLASLEAAAPLCGQLEPLFDSGDSAGGLGLHRAQLAFRGRVLPDACQEPPGTKVTQRHRSGLVDACKHSKLCEEGDQSFKAHMALCG